VTHDRLLAEPTEGTRDRTDEDELQEARSVQGNLAALDLELRPALEAVLMIADEPLDHLSLAQAVGAPPAQVRDALEALAAEYTEQGRGFDLREVGAGWRYYTREEYAPVVEQFVVEGQQARLTQAALETLAVVAYRQPISRGRVSAIRGVNVDGVMRTLLARGLVEESGADSETGAHLYRTTSYFLERMGLTSIDELPEIAPFLPEMTEIEDELAPAELSESGARRPESGQPSPAQGEQVPETGQAMSQPGERTSQSSQRSPEPDHA
jgi:segregation and condensation protein B